MADSALFLILTKRPLLAFENDVMEWRVHPWNLLSTIYAKFLKILMSGSWLINSELEKWMRWKQLNNPKYPYLRLWISVANFNLREEYEYKHPEVSHLYIAYITSKTYRDHARIRIFTF